jgi:hypothetical protein
MPRRESGEPDGDGGSGGGGSVKEMQFEIEVALKKVAKTMLVMVALTMMKFRDGNLLHQQPLHRRVHPIRPANKFRGDQSETMNS